MNERKNLGGRVAAFFGLSLLFFAPALIRVLDLVETTELRNVDVVLVMAGAFGAGVLFCLAISTWRQSRA